MNAFTEPHDLEASVRVRTVWISDLHLGTPGCQAAALLEPQLRLAKVDTEAVPNLGSRFAIRSIPTLALFHQGREIARQSGAMGRDDIVRWARAQLQRAGLQAA